MFTQFILKNKPIKKMASEKKLDSQLSELLDRKPSSILNGFVLNRKKSSRNNLEDALNVDYQALSDKPSLTLEGTYKVTLTSTSNIGTFSSEGMAFVKKLPSVGEYEIQAVFQPINAPLYAIQRPYYIHGIAHQEEKNLLSSGITFSCSGKVYVQKSVIYKIIEGDNIPVKFKKPNENKTIEYSFSQNPFTLWGFEPGKIKNSGTLTRISEKVDVNLLDPADPEKVKEFKEHMGWLDLPSLPHP